MTCAKSYIVIHQTFRALTCDARTCMCACLYMSHVCRFRFPLGIRAISTAPSCHAGTIELLRLIAPTSLSRPIVVVLIIVSRSIFFFYVTHFPYDARLHSAGTRQRPRSLVHANCGRSWTSFWNFG